MAVAFASGEALWPGRGGTRGEPGDRRRGLVVRGTVRQRRAAHGRRGPFETAERRAKTLRAMSWTMTVEYPGRTVAIVHAPEFRRQAGEPEHGVCGMYCEGERTLGN